MRELGVLWKRCHSGSVPRGEWRYERRVIIGDSEPYYDIDIVNLTHDKALLYNSFSVGNCISGEIKLTLLPRQNQLIRYKDKLKLEIRISTLNNGDTEWFEFGHYLIKQAEEEFGKWIIHGYDSMILTDVPLTEDVYGKPSWPTSAQYMVGKITEYLGIELDDRTVLNPSVRPKKPKDISIREALKYIGELHAGNWYITEENKLRMVVPKLRGKINTVDKSNSKRIIKEEPIIISKVKFRYNTKPNDYHESGVGDDSMELLNPWATQYNTDSVRNILSNFTYHPYNITSTEIDPALELGDTIEIEGNNVNLWAVSYSLRMYANLNFPSGDVPKKDYDILLFNNNKIQDRFDEYDLQLEELRDMIEELKPYDDENLYDYSIIGNKVSIKGLNQSYIDTNLNGVCPTKLTIPYKIKGYPVTEIDRLTSHSGFITEVITPKSLIKIGNSAFNTGYVNGVLEDDSVLQSVTLNDGIEVVEDNAFMSCEALANINLPNSITKISENAFRGCMLSGELVLPDSLTHIGGESFAYNRISKVIIGRSLKDVYGFNNNEITSMHIPSNVVSVNQFSYNNISQLTFDEGVQSIGEDAFSNNGLSEISLPSSLLSIGRASFYNNNLTNVESIQNLTSIGAKAFMNNNLTQISIPDGVVEIEPQTFSGNNITSLTTNNVVSIGYEAFMDNKISVVNISNSLLHIGKESFKNNLIKELDLNNVISVGDSSFYNNKLSKVVLSNYMDVVNYGTFQYNLLGEITIPDNIVEIKDRAFDKEISNDRNFGLIDVNIMPTDSITYDNPNSKQFVLLRGFTFEGSKQYVAGVIIDRFWNIK